MARRTTTTRGIGTGTAQIFDTSQSQRAFERGQGIQAQKRQQDAAARKTFVDDQMEKLKELSNKEVWEGRDRGTYQSEWNNVTSKYNGRWQDVYQKPEVMSEFIQDTNQLLNMSRASLEQKEEYDRLLRQYDAPGNKDHIREEGVAAMEAIATDPTLLFPENRDKFMSLLKEARTYNTEEINPLERFGELFNRNAVEVVADGTRVVNGQKISSGSTYVPRTPKGDNPGFDNTALSIVKNMNAAERQAIGEKYGDGELTDEAIKAFVDDAYGIYASGRSDEYSATPFDDGSGGIDWNQWYSDPVQTDYEYSEKELNTIASPRGRAQIEIEGASYVGNRKELPAGGFKANITPSKGAIDFVTGRPLKATSGQVNFSDWFVPKEDVNGLKAGQVYLVGTTSSELTGTGEPTMTAVPINDVRSTVVSEYGEDGFNALRQTQTGWSEEDPL